MSSARSASSFSYSARHRWAYVPTLGFLVVLVVILVTNPGLIWQNAESGPLRSATLLAAGLAIAFAVALVARWASPFRFELASDALVAFPLIGSPRRVPYAQIRDVTIQPKTFLRGVPEVLLRVESGSPITIRTDIGGYQQLERNLRRRLAPEVQARWKEARG
jgi:hypothetical protein